MTLNVLYGCVRDLLTLAPAVVAAAGCAAGRAEYVAAPRSSLGICDPRDAAAIQGYLVCPNARALVDYLTAHFAGDCTLRCRRFGKPDEAGTEQSPLVEIVRQCNLVFSSESVMQRADSQKRILRLADGDNDGIVTAYEALHLSGKTAQAQKVMCAAQYGLDPANAFMYIKTEEE